MTFVDWLPFITSLVVVILGALLNKRAQNANIAAQMASAYEKLKGLYEDRICILEKRLNEMTRGVNILITQLRRNNIEPEWTPHKVEDQPLAPPKGSQW